MKKSKVIELFPLVCCLPGKEHLEIEKTTMFKLKPKFYHKSGTELRLEHEQQTKLLTHKLY